jgi:hypothetical protein
MNGPSGLPSITVLDVERAIALDADHGLVAARPRRSRDGSRRSRRAKRAWPTRRS